MSLFVCRGPAHRAGMGAGHRHPAAEPLAEALRVSALQVREFRIHEIQISKVQGETGAVIHHR